MVQIIKQLLLILHSTEMHFNNLAKLMKKHIFLLAFIPLLGIINQARGQTVTTHKNAVVHSKFTVPTTNPADGSNPDKAISTITYADGLGRELQSVAYQLSPPKKIL